MLMKQPILRIEDLSVRYPVYKGFLQRQVAQIKAVEKVTLTLKRGEAFGLVGESGCGKTTLARTVLRLVNATEGSIWFEGENITNLDGAALAPYRKRVAAVFQDPFSSLNPRMRAGNIIAEVLGVHGFEGDAKCRVIELFDLCGLSERFFDLYPHQMSGGQRQRVGIARALAIEPDLIVCDEAVSALDVSIQAQIINLLEELRVRLNLTYLFIGHDLSIVRHLCDRVAVMYLGRVVEVANSEELFSKPQHPYTRALIEAVPNPDPKSEVTREFVALNGEVPSPLNPPTGCVFHPRCPIAINKCSSLEPTITNSQSGHDVACHAFTLLPKDEK